MNRQSRQFEYMSLDDFEELLADKPADEKWELISGRVVRMMVGARWEHNRIIANLLTSLMSSLRAKGSSCRPFSETFYLKDHALDLAALPDVIVRCGSLDADATSLNDPVVLVEVVSKGSEQRDRWEKWGSYQHLGSLKHYVLVERDRIAIDVIDRMETGWFNRPRLEASADLLKLPAIDFEMSVAEVYRDVFA